MCTHRFEVKTDYQTGIATETCRICGEVKEVQGTMSKVSIDIKNKRLNYRKRTQDEKDVSYLVRQTTYKITGRMEK